MAWPRLATFLPVVFALAACGGGSSNSAKSNAAGAATTAGSTGRQVTAVETEYHIQLSTTSLQPGLTTFVAMNKGKVAHSLEVDGPGVSDKRVTGTVAPGSSMQLTVTLRKGSYEIYCPVDGHKGLGMDLHVTVGGGTATGAKPSTTTTKTGKGY